jgi:hypothetical protein
MTNDSTALANIGLAHTSTSTTRQAMPTLWNGQNDSNLTRRSAISAPRNVAFWPIADASADRVRVRFPVESRRQKLDRGRQLLTLSENSRD